MVCNVALYGMDKGLIDKGIELKINYNEVKKSEDVLDFFNHSLNISKSIYVRCLRNNTRSFSASTKTRGEVSFSNKKMWKQKGTGRARVKSAASPLWRKGGVLFGPRPGGRKLLFNKKLSFLVWQNLFLNFINNGSVVCLDVDDLSFGINTKKFMSVLDACVENIKESFVVLILNSEAINIARSAANIPNISLQLFGQLDYLKLAKADKILFLKSDKELFENLVR